MSWGLNREKDPALDNFPIMPIRFKNAPEMCLYCKGELVYPSCNIRLYLCPEFKDPMKFQQRCTPMCGVDEDSIKTVEFKELSKTVKLHGQDMDIEQICEYPKRPRKVIKEMPPNEADVSL